MSTGLYLTVTAAGQGAEVECLERAIAAAKISAILVVPADSSAATAAIAADLVRTAQTHSIAALIEAGGTPDSTLNADGIHIPWSEDVAAKFAEIHASAGGKLMVGADAGRSRHDAMLIGEAGADYVAFGIPGHVEDREKAASRRLDLVSWWSEIFEIPVVAFDVTNASEAAALAAAGADFISIRLPPGLAASEVADWIVPYAAALSGPQSKS